MARHKTRNPKAPKNVKVSVSASTSGGVSQPALPQPAPVVTIANPTPAAGEPALMLLTQETYDKHRATLVDHNKANTDQHDKAILQLTGVTLVLSVTFVDKIAHNPHPFTFWLLWLGWTWLASSMAAMLLSFHTGLWAGNAQIAWLDKLF